MSSVDGMEYRPTIYAWLILFFIVFPLIYLAGRVVGCLLRVFFRVLLGVVEFLTFDWLMYEEVEEMEVVEVTEDAQSKRTRELQERAQRNKERRRERRVMPTQIQKAVIGEQRVSVVIEESTKEIEENEEEEEGLGSECETTTDEGLKCTPERDISSGFGSTPSPNKNGGMNGISIDTTNRSINTSELTKRNKKNKRRNEMQQQQQRHNQGNGSIANGKKDE